MSEIEKMYENARIEKTKGDCLFYPLDVHTCGRSYDECLYYYPPFTAEKQIELIKWMIKTNHRYFIQYISVDNFSETIASIFNSYWQSLTPEEKQQVKGILE